MAEQIVLNFDSSEFEGFDSTQEYFCYMTRTVKGESGGVVQQKYQAADMEMSPAQWSQKCNESNNTGITLRDADKHTEIFGDTRWIDYLVWKHIINGKKRNREQLLKMKEQIEKQLGDMK